MSGETTGTSTTASATGPTTSPETGVAPSEDTVKAPKIGFLQSGSTLNALEVTNPQYKQLEFDLETATPNETLSGLLTHFAHGGTFNEVVSAGANSPEATQSLENTLAPLREAANILDGGASNGAKILRDQNGNVIIETLNEAGERESLTIGEQLLVGAFFLGDMLLNRGRYTQMLVGSFLDRIVDTGFDTYLKSIGYEDAGESEKKFLANKLLDAMSPEDMEKFLKESKEKAIFEFLAMVPEGDRQKMLTGEYFGGSGAVGKHKLSTGQIGEIISKLTEEQIHELKIGEQVHKSKSSPH